MTPIIRSGTAMRQQRDARGLDAARHDALRDRLATAVGRERIGAAEGLSGTPVERVFLPGGGVLVTKRVLPDGDWLMRGMHDDGRAARLWLDGILAEVPPVLEHGVVGVVEEDEGWLLVMRDLGSSLLPEGVLVTRAESRRLIGALAALHAHFAGRSIPGLCPLADRYTLLSPGLTRREAGGSALIPTLVERGWELFADVAAGDVADVVLRLLDDPSPLVGALAACPCTLVHGDAKLPNLGLAGERVVVIDWGSATGIAPSSIDWAWYLATSASRIGGTREDVLEDMRAAEGERYDPRSMGLGLLGALVQLGWNKAFDSTQHPDPAVRLREQADLDWWVRRARPTLEQWPL
jgi:hypothetical protein